MEGKYSHVITTRSVVSPVSTFQPDDHLSRKLIWPLCHWRSLPRRTFQFPRISNNDMTDARNCEVGATFFFFLWHYSPNSGLGLPPWTFLFHFSVLDSRQSVGLRKASTYTQTQENTHTYINTKHRCPGWDSKPRFRRQSERRQCML
jgi:hypothetical protein